MRKSFIKMITGKGRPAALAAGAVVLASLLAVLAAAAQAPSFLAGRVKTVGVEGQPLSERVDQALREGGRGLIFTAYLFESRHKIHYHGEGRIVETYDVENRGAKIHIRARNGRDEEGFSTDEEKNTPAPAGLLLLYDGSRPGTVLDASVLDPEKTYEFGDTPVAWLGKASNDESMALVESLFAAGGKEHLKTTLLFLASCHTGLRGYVFVKKVASSPEDPKVRESAVFWLGNYGDARSLADLKSLFGSERSAQVKKQIVFAMQLNKSKDATAELIAVARKDADREIRKTAIFWLGQKASAESVKALKDIVDADGEDGIRDQAVFALSQLPKDRSVPILIDIAKTHKSASVRKKAIFWLGQTGSEEALKYFEDILLKK